MSSPSPIPPPRATRESIRADVTEILAHFNGREYSGMIGPETRFFADLGLASIDAVVLGETLQSHYGRPLPFGELMADLGARAERDMSVREVTDFLERYLLSDA